MLVGERLYLRPMEAKDVPYRVKWINDPVVRRTLNFDYPISEIGTQQWLQRVASDSNRKDFIACRIADDTPIGYAGFLNIDWKARKAESYFGIGEPSEWGKGYGTEMRRIQLRYAFTELGLNRVYAYVWTENEAMIALNMKVGFTIEGRLRQDVYSHGEYRDRYIMSMLREDYERIFGEET